MKKRDVIVACDFDSAERTLAFLDRFRRDKPFVKIGMELFYAEGPDIVRAVKARGHRVFLDLKLHDIPNTMRQAMAALAGLGVDMCNLHAGTVEAMSSALQGLDPDPDRRPLVIAVTQLTSVSGRQLRDELLITAAVEETVLHYAGNAKKAGLSGVVCSALESRSIKQAFGPDFLTVTPGIRFAEDSRQDQARTATPAAAKQAGVDYIVVGRPITGAPDPVAVYRRCVADFL